MTNTPFSDSVSPLEKAVWLQEMAAGVGLDWPEAGNVWASVNQGLAEAKAASEDMSVLASRIASRALREGRSINEEKLDSAYELLSEDLGDLLFAVVDVCRTLRINPQEALEISNRKFAKCFEYVIEKTSKSGIMLGLESPERIKQLWLEARRQRCRNTNLSIYKKPSQQSDQDISSTQSLA